MLSLVIPCYNEADNLPLLFERCKALSNSDVEVILVDNGSTDHTPKVLSAMLPLYRGVSSVRVEKNQGYGFGILAGLKAAKGEFLGWTHADLQTDPRDVLIGLALFKQYGNNLFVKGRRQKRPFFDVVFTAGMSVFETLLLAKPLRDINAQPTLFSRRFFETWNAPPNDFSLDLYAYYQARVKSLRVRRFPVHFGKRAFGVSHWNVNLAAKCKFIERTVKFSLELKKDCKMSLTTQKPNSSNQGGTLR